MTIREYLKAETSDKRVNITATLATDKGEIVTYAMDKEAFDEFYSKTPYLKYMNKEEALMKAGDALDRNLYQVSYYGDFILLDYKVAMA